MQRAQITCPNCRQPVMVAVQQLFDVGVNPADKQIFLSSAVNNIECPNCGFRGALGTPVVYHDPDKELLLSFIPPEMKLQREEQERVIGSMLKQVMDKLPPERRKAYLLNPQSFLTFQSLVERILEADGITKEMIQAQQKKIQIIQRLINGPDEAAQSQVISEEESNMDETFFNLFTSLFRSASLSGDENTLKKFTAIQDKLLKDTKLGQLILLEAREVEEARKSLETLGENISQEQLLEIVVTAPNETRLGALVNFTRPAMDYAFFQLLTNKIAAAKGEEQKRLMTLRSQLLEMTSEYDLESNALMAKARQNYDILMKAENIETAILQNLPVVDDAFLKIVGDELAAARKAGDLEKSTKLNKVIEVIRQISSPPEALILEGLLGANSDEEIRNVITESKLTISKEFLEFLENVVKRAQTTQDDELLTRAQRVYDVAKGMAG
jgi:hypothetical protein